MDRKRGYEYVLYLFGVLLPACVLSFNFNLFKFSPLFIFVIGIETILYAFLKQKIKHFALIAFAFLMAFIVATFPLLKTGFMLTYNIVVSAYTTGLGFSLSKFSISGTPLMEQHVAIFIFLLVVFSLSIGIVYRYTLHKKSNGKTFLWTLLMSAPNFIVQMKFNWFFILSLFIYWACLALPSMKENISLQVRGRQIQVLGGTIVIVAVSILLVLPEHQFRKLYAPVSIQENFVDTINAIVQKVSFLQYQQDEIDLSNAGNRNYANVTHFIVENGGNKELYLKTFSGSIYEENKWDIFPEQRYMLSYDNREILYDTLIDSIRVDRLLELPYYPYEQITIQDYRKGDHYALQPYFISKIEQEYTPVFDYALKIKDEQIHYQVWNDLNKDSFNEQRSNYHDFVKSNYLEVPVTITRMIPETLKLKYPYELKQEYIDQLVANSSIPGGTGYTDMPEGFFEFDEGYAEFVKEYICSFLKKYEYTLKPGRTPDGQDFVSYFLLKNKKGYCVHFATASTLMFRYYGVPARYVEGYYVSNDQYKDNHQADVLDSDAHAWVEVYDRRMGWHPMEVTVGYISSNDPDNTVLPVDPSPDQPDQPDKPNRPDNPNPNDKPETPTHQPEKTDILDIDVEMLILPGVVLALIFGYGIFRFFKIYHRKRKFAQEDRQQAVYEMAAYLDAIHRSYPILNPDVVRIFEKNKFSKHAISDEEMSIVKKMIDDDVKVLYKNLSSKDKLKFKFIKFWL